MIDLKTITKDEETIFNLRSLYERYGYSQFKMNKFEEYELYVRNKDFLVSNNIISFTDTDGKLMALKPDVTLSIIKNGNDEKQELQKVYYNENVYRVSKKNNSFNEIIQVGLECIGNVDDYSVLEVILLAIKSLECVSSNYVLDISHLGIIKELLDELDISESEKKLVFKCFREKNTHDLSKIDGAEKLVKLLSTYGNLSKIKVVLDEIYQNNLSSSARLLVEIIEALEVYGYKERVRIDFSVLNDLNYYSGIVFNGFIKDIPTRILSGGQYDYLMKKMGRKSKGLGFAVYLDLLEEFNEKNNDYDIDTLIVYDKNVSIIKINDEVNIRLKKGERVLANNSISTKLKYKTLIQLKDGEENEQR